MAPATIAMAIAAASPAGRRPDARGNVAPMSDDLALLESWRAGDVRAGQALFRRYFHDVYRFFEHKVGPEADELVQQTFAASVAAAARFRGGSSFRTYLFAIARNQLYSFLRRLPSGEHIDFDAVSLADLVTSAAGRLGRARDVERLHAALATLPVEQQLLLELHYWQELDAEALGEVFESPPGTIRVRLARARKALRARMSELELAQLDASTDGLSAALTRPEEGDLEP